MEEFHRTVPFGCRRCWHVWEEHYIVRRLDDQHGNAGEVWLKGEVCVPPPLAGAICPRCGSPQAATFPEGYLAHHPEAIPPAEPATPDPTPLISPVPRRPAY
ncbi:hypothetical protein SAMN05421874_11332 [Nonomuraea maritima]|uniref:Uncharacterized protein n=1 Tax=Nonomuraea maritima TaxID=683260 RepID=A0A1G9FVR8_9ACTN|nr:hypothetical protein SAMN05421874_11332 [Nonomuraea maritima]